MPIIVAIFISMCMGSILRAELITTDTFCICFCVIWAGALAGTRSK